MPCSDAPNKAKKLSPYFVFCKQHRDEAKAQLQAAGQPASASAVSKALGERWRSLSAEDKRKYSDQPASASPLPSEALANDEQVNNGSIQTLSGDWNGHAEEQGAPEKAKREAKEQGSKDVDAMDKKVEGRFDAAGDGGPVLAFPLNRVKRIVKADKDIRVMAADASVLVGLASQLFLEHLACTAYDAAAAKKHKTVRLEDLHNAVKAEARVDEFLGDALKEVLAGDDNNSEEEDGEDDEDGDHEGSSNPHACPKNDAPQKKARTSKKVELPPPPGNRRIADFFGAKPAHPHIPNTQTT